MNIALIGMPGSGKTTVGKELKKILKNYSYFDTDEEIVRLENRSINEIFAKDGEAYFREVETKVLFDILKNDNQIISTGGGIVKSEKNVKELKEKAFTIYLKTDCETLYKRVKSNKERPLLNDKDVFEKIKTLLIERETLYENAASKIIETSNKTSKEIAAEIERNL